MTASRGRPEGTSVHREVRPLRPLMAGEDRPPNLLLGRISGDIPADRDDLSARLRDPLVRLQWPGEVIPEDSRGVVAGPFQEGSVEAASATGGSFGGGGSFGHGGGFGGHR